MKKLTIFLFSLVFLTLPFFTSAEPSSFTLTYTTFNPTMKAFFVSITYTGTDPSSVAGRYYRISLGIPELSRNFDNTYGWNSSSNLQNITYSAGYHFLSDSDIASLLKIYPSGIIPVNVSLRLGTKEDATSAYKDSAELVLETSGSFDLVVYSDNHTYKIGVVQVLPPGFDLSKKRLCLGKDENNNPRGYYPVGNGDEENCSKWDWDGSGSRSTMISPYSLSDILFSNNLYTSVLNIIRPTYKDDTAETINAYSLKSIGKYWNNVLAKHGITDTVLGKNPRFDVTLLPPIQKANTLTSSDHATVKSFFSDAVSSSGLNLSSFDFIVYIQYVVPGQGFGFERSFAAGSKVYASFPLSTQKLLYNNGFLTVVHELGHAIFGLADLYDGLAIKYPEGVPDPVNFPQKNACIMSKNFGLSKYSDTQVRKYETGIYVAETAPPAGLSHFYTENPNNFVLCADDVVKISRRKENPNCSLADFYAGRCGRCTSLNYLSCTKNPITTTQISTAPAIGFITNTSSIVRGQQASLFWGSVRATSCQGNWNLSILPTKGSHNVSPTITTVYTITCKGAGGSAVKSLTVSVIDPVVTTAPVVTVPNMTTSIITATTSVSVAPPVIATTTPIVSTPTSTTQTQTPTPKFNVLSPVMGEQIQAGRQYIIRWTYSGPAGVSTVGLSLYKNGGFRDFITTDTVNDGQYEWNVSDYLAGGSDYQARIFSSYYTNNYTDSGKFAIVSPDASAPASQTAVVPQSTIISTITVSPTTTTTISLLPPPTPETTTSNQITTNTTPTSSSTPPTSPISSESTTTTTTTTETSVAPRFVISVPASGASLVAGSSYTVTWQMTQGNSTSIRLSLYQNGGFKDFIIADTANDGSHQWTVPGSIGSTYSIRIVDLVYPNNYADSGQFSIVASSAAADTMVLASIIDSVRVLINQLAEEIKNLRR